MPIVHPGYAPGSAAQSARSSFALKFPGYLQETLASRSKPPRVLARQQRAWVRAERATDLFAAIFPVRADEVSVAPAEPRRAADLPRGRRTHMPLLLAVAVHTSDLPDGRVLAQALAEAGAGGHAGPQRIKNGSDTRSACHPAHSRRDLLVTLPRAASVHRVLQ